MPISERATLRHGSAANINAKTVREEPDLGAAGCPGNDYRAGGINLLQQIRKEGFDGVIAGYWWPDLRLYQVVIESIQVLRITMDEPVYSVAGYPSGFV